MKILGINFCCHDWYVLLTEVDWSTESRRRHYNRVCLKCNKTEMNADKFLAHEKYENKKYWAKLDEREKLTHKIIRESK